MRRATTTATIALGLVGLVAGPALAGTSSGQGAQRSALYQASESSGQCQPGGSGSSEGWGMLNLTGKVGASMSTVQGEVHVVDPSLAGQTLQAYAVAPGGSCMSMVASGPITVNAQGIGNGHLTGVTSPGQYYVVIENSQMQEVLAGTVLTLS